MQNSLQLPDLSQLKSKKVGEHTWFSDHTSYNEHEMVQREKIKKLSSRPDHILAVVHKLKQELGMCLTDVR